MRVIVSDAGDHYKIKNAKAHLYRECRTSNFYRL